MSILSQLDSLISTGYVLLFLLLAALVLWLIPSRRWKAITLLMLFAAFAYPVVVAEMAERTRLAQNQMIAERFMKLCKEKAGDKIYKTVEGVSGFLIMRPRKPTTSLQEYLDQNWMGDPYGHSDLEARSPEQMFLADRPRFDGSSRTIRAIAGYDYIELPLPLREQPGAVKYRRMEVTRRYVDAGGQHSFEYTSIDSPTALSRYGYEWADISTAEDRQFWIAGGTMRIVDLQTRTVIAERVGYVIDTAQGTRPGGAMPWLTAERNACPPFEGTLTKSKEFVSSVLKPTRSVR